MVYRVKATTFLRLGASGGRVRKITLNPAETTSKERIYLGTWEVHREHHNLNTIPTLDLERETLHIHDDTGRIVLVETKTVEDDDPIVDPENIPRYQYSNHLGSASLELDEDGEIISYEEYYPFGSSSYVATNGTIEVSAKRYRYTGKERDEETGLQYNAARYYASWIGRWNSADPIGIRGGVNLFSYVCNNPLRLRDPGGTSPAENEISAAEADIANQRKAYGQALQQYQSETAQYRLAQSQGVSGERLRDAHAELSAFYGALVAWDSDLVKAKIALTGKKERLRAYEEGGPEWGNISGRTITRVEGFTKLSGAVTGSLFTGVVGLVIGLDFGQAGLRQGVTGYSADTAMRAGTVAFSEAMGNSPHEAQVHGEMAEMLIPAAISGAQLGHAAGRSTKGLPPTKYRAPRPGGRNARPKQTQRPAQAQQLPHGPYYHRIKDGGFDDILRDHQMISQNARVAAGGSGQVNAVDGAFDLHYYSGTRMQVFEFRTATEPPKHHWMFGHHTVHWPVEAGDTFSIQIMRAWNGQDKEFPLILFQEYFL